MNIVSDNIHTVLHCLHNSPNSHLSTSNCEQFLTLTLCPISFVLHLFFAVVSPLTSVFASCYSSLDSIAVSIFAVAVATLLAWLQKIAWKMFDDRMGCLSDTTTQHERSSVFPQRNCSFMLGNIYKLVIDLNSQEGKEEIFNCALRKNGVGGIVLELPRFILHLQWF